MIARTLRLDRPLDVFRTFALHRRGPHDPTMRLAGSEMWRATRTPDGPGSIYLVAHANTIEAQAWGAGAGWLIDRVDALVGTDDDPEAFVPIHDVLRSLQRGMPGMRIGRSDRVIEALVPAIIEQKVTSHEAHRAYRKMVYAWGEPAPGPVRLRVPPEPARLVGTPYYEFHRFGLERKRADVIRAVCARAARLEECSELPRQQAAARLRS
ncbi:MAG: DNA-3-methyladenine glycosylase 2 family protein, partial [Actinomycetota bacterium]|nr:DNA-3-methyladenine glycosylase 2 family protein [Actinomycetota bacterium]